MRITVLAENTTTDENLQAEMGVSAFIEVDGKHILFDTGQSDTFIQNALQLGVDLNTVDFVALSHGHFDHTRGFLSFVDAGFTNYQLLIHRHFFTPKFWDQEVSYYYVGNAFSQEYINFKRIPTAMISHETHRLWEDGDTYLISNFLQTCTFEPRDPVQLQLRGGDYCVDDFREEMSLVVDTPKGLVVISGCAHNGVVNTVETAKARFGKPVYAFIGGTHLIAADQVRAQKTIDYFNQSEIEIVAACHCTGEIGLQMFADQCKKYLPMGSGTIIEI